MKTIAATILATTIAATGLVATTAVTAAAEGARQICYADPAVLVHTPYLLEDTESDAFLDGMIVRDFPNSVAGCQGYDGTPLQEWESLYVARDRDPAAPAAPTITVVPDCTATNTVRYVTEPGMIERLDRRAAKIHRLQAQIRRLQGR